MIRSAALNTHIYSGKAILMAFRMSFDRLQTCITFQRDQFTVKILSGIPCHLSFVVVVVVEIGDLFEENRSIMKKERSTTKLSVSEIDCKFLSCSTQKRAKWCCVYERCVALHSIVHCTHTLTQSSGLWCRNAAVKYISGDNDECKTCVILYFPANIPAKQILVRKWFFIRLWFMFSFQQRWKFMALSFEPMACVCILRFPFGPQNIYIERDKHFESKKVVVLWFHWNFVYSIVWFWLVIW